MPQRRSAPPEPFLFLGSTAFGTDMSTFIRHIRFFPATLRLWKRIVSVQTRLSILAAAESLAVRMRRASPWRLAGTLAVVAAIATPSALYLRERSRSDQFVRAYRALAVETSAEVATLRYTMGNLLNEQVQMRELLTDAGYAVYSDNQFLVDVVATGYSSSVIETDDTPFITASNTRTRTGILAMSRDMLRRYNPDAPFAFGDVVHVSGIGDFIVEDSMNPRWRRRVDVWFPSRTAAFRFGRRRVTIVKVRKDEQPATRFNRPVNLADRRTASSP